VEKNKGISKDGLEMLLRRLKERKREKKKRRARSKIHTSTRDEMFLLDWKKEKGPGRAAE
jgi:hypothetical protein